MEYKIAARPTVYKAIQFRSRLEARWAAFFDLLEWPWIYEPVSFENWVPDFEVDVFLHGVGRPTTERVLVEVKPYEDLSQFEGHPIMGYPGSTLCLGNSQRISRLKISLGVFEGNVCYDDWQRDWNGPAAYLFFPHPDPKKFEIQIREHWDSIWSRANNATRWDPNQEMR